MWMIGLIPTTALDHTPGAIAMANPDADVSRQQSDCEAEDARQTV